MKQIFLTITLFSILAILPSVIFARSAEKPFTGCQFIVEDAACSQYLGKTQAEIESLIGKPDKGTGDYYRLGTWFFFVQHKKDNVYRASEILFFGESKDTNYSPFAGKPAKNLNWSAKKEEVIKKYGNPASQVTFDNGNRVTLKYGRVEFQFKDNRLTSIRLIDVEGEELRQIANKQLEDQKMQNALSDCKFILDGKGCWKYFGKSAEEITELFGKQLKHGSYPDLGIFFYIWAYSEENEWSTVREVTFYNGGENIKQFPGQPGGNLSWNATREDVINQYGNPTKETSSVGFNNLPQTSLSYGENVRIIIENNRIKQITIISPKHVQSVEAYFRRLKEKIERSEKEEADKQREQANVRNTTTGSNNSSPVIPNEIQKPFDQLHNQIRTLQYKINKKIMDFNKFPYLNQGVTKRKKIEQEISDIRNEQADLIRKFLKDYDGKLPKAIIDHLNGDIDKLLSGKGH